MDSILTIVLKEAYGRSKPSSMSFERFKRGVLLEKRGIIVENDREITARGL